MEGALPADLADYVRITRLQSAYADIVTRGGWDELDRIFVPDIPIIIDRQDGTPLTLTGAAALTEFVTGLTGHLDFFQFVNLNTIVDIDGDRASARLYMCEIRHDARAGQTMSYGLYRDRYVRIDGRWWFAERRFRVMARTQTTAFNVFPLQPPDFAIGAGAASA